MTQNNTSRLVYRKLRKVRRADATSPASKLTFALSGKRRKAALFVLAVAIPVCLFCLPRTFSAGVSRAEAPPSASDLFEEPNVRVTTEDGSVIVSTSPGSAESDRSAANSRREAYGKLPLQF